MAIALLAARPAHEWLLDRFADAELVIRQQPIAGSVLFVLLAAISAMIAFVSSAVLIPVAIYVWGPTLCFVLLWLGWFLGGLVAYAIGRYLGRPAVCRLVRPDALERQERWARSGGKSLAAILLIQLAIPSDLAGYVFGLIRCPLRTFIVALAVVEIPYALGAVFLGMSFVERRLVPLVIVGVAGAVLSVAAFQAYHRHLDVPGAGSGTPSS
ncbi:MAG: TVP38/TMEM64 family protein [Gemmatimonadales bacterium]